KLATTAKRSTTEDTEHTEEQTIGLRGGALFRFPPDGRTRRIAQNSNARHRLMRPTLRRFADHRQHFVASVEPRPPQRLAPGKRVGHFQGRIVREQRPNRRRMTAAEKRTI